MSEPYFKGQKPGLCGCYYPDVLRAGDTFKDGRLVRTFRPESVGKVLSPPEVVRNRQKIREGILTI